MGWEFRERGGGRLHPVGGSSPSTCGEGERRRLQIPRGEKAPCFAFLSRPEKGKRRTSIFPGLTSKKRREGIRGSPSPEPGLPSGLEGGRVEKKKKTCYPGPARGRKDSILSRLQEFLLQAGRGKKGKKCSMAGTIREGGSATISLNKKKER